MNHERCVSVVMPCYNEAATIVEIMERVLASPWTQELLLVDDASTDGSAELARLVDDPRVRLFQQPTNRGKGAALRRGLAEARARYVIVQDADLEYNPADFDQMIEPLLRDDADVVYGSRFHSSQPHRVLYFWHSAGNRLLTIASNMMTNLNLTDMETCYKAFRREVLETIDLEEDRFGFEPEITAKAAAGPWRIYEVGISYDGRTYSEGKKISWKDGVHAISCILRYSPLGLRLSARQKGRRTQPASFNDADAELADVLESLAVAVNYANWIFDLMAPHLGARILEVGAGHGTMTERLRTRGRVTATELSERSASLLGDRFRDDPQVEVRHGGLPAVHGEYDSAVLVNVLEHIEDDAAILRGLAQSLCAGGTLVLFVPALQSLYSDFDRRIGHYRRYERTTLAAAVREAGFDIVDLRYVNAFGAIAWWLLARRLGGTPTNPHAVRLYDRLVVPIARHLEDRRQPPLGQSFFCVARRTST